MMVVDTSALVAIFEQEPEAEDFLRAIAEADDVVISAVQLHKAGTVMHRRRGPGAARRVIGFLQRHRIRVLPFDHDDALAAIAAYQRFGKGTGHPAQLNLADCAAYALATRLNAPLLFKGDDFTRTGVAAAARSA